VRTPHDSLTRPRRWPLGGPTAYCGVVTYFGDWVNSTEPAPFALKVRAYYRGVLAALPLVVLAALMVMDLWVYRDASARAEQGRPVVFSLGSLRIDSPGTWLAACLVLSVLFIPIYLSIRTP
jgi:hypothetical protein